MTYGLFGSFVARPGARDELLGILVEAAAALERDPGCLHYVVSTSEDPHRVWVWEAWTDRAAHDASLEPPEVRELIMRGRPLIAGAGESTELDVAGGKGLPAR